jgi:aspartyl-tRNA(Asn)/glutamyl-tRNA(Gln) amidotransferase subunit A
MRTMIESAEAVRRGGIKAVALVEESLAAVAARNPALNAFIMMRSEQALAEAADIDRRIGRGEDPGPLAGVPFGVKDIEDLAGLPTTQGSLLLRDAPPATRDSGHVARLRAAGAIPIGKTNICEFGIDSSTYNRLWGTTRNPWNVDLTPGGSSGGSSAAVAGGMVPFATATDGSGSTRCPAAFTGLIGLKPSHGRIAKDDGFANWAVHGALTRTVADTARYLDVAAGPDDRDRQSLPPAGVVYEHVIETLDVAGLQAVWSGDLGYAVVEPEVLQIARRGAETLIAAAGLVECTMDFRPTNTVVPLGIINLMRSREDMTASGVLPGRFDDLGLQLQYWLRKAEHLTAAEVAESWGKVRTLQAEMAEFFRHADLLLTPATACVAYPAAALIPEIIDGRDASQSMAEPFGLIANICWNPSISIPVGVTRAGLPVGLQVIGRRHRDDVMLRLARILEQAQPWSFPWGADG